MPDSALGTRGSGMSKTHPCPVESTGHSKSIKMSRRLQSQVISTLWGKLILEFVVLLPLYLVNIYFEFRNNIKGEGEFFVHAFIQKLFVKHLLCAGPCVFHGGNNM